MCVVYINLYYATAGRLGVVEGFGVRAGLQSGLERTDLIGQWKTLIPDLDKVP